MSTLKYPSNGYSNGTTPIMVKGMTQKTRHRVKGEGAFFQDKHGVWIGRVELPTGRDGKRRVKKVTSKNKGVAARKFRALKEELEKQGGDTSTRTYYLHEWMTYYLDEIAPETDRPGWLSDKRGYSKDWIVPMLGKKKIDAITARDVRRLRKAVLSTPRLKKWRDIPKAEWPDNVAMLSVSTANNIHTALSAALSAAIEEGQLTENVCHLVTKPKPRRAENNSLTVEQIRTVWEALDAHEHGALFATYLLTGARRGEIAGLEIDRYDGTALDISWQLQAIKKDTDLSPDFDHRHIVGSRYLTRPKTDTGIRAAPVIAPLKLILDAHIGDRTDGFIFVNTKGDPHYPTTITKQWKIFMTSLGLDHVTLHGARHALIDLLHDASVSPGIIQDIVGHASLDMTRSYRTRANMDGAARGLESAWDLLQIEA